MKTHQITWDNSNYTAVLAPLGDGIDQCSIACEGEEMAHLFLLRTGPMALVDIELKEDIEPCDGLLLAIGRILVEHKRAVREGRALV